MLGTYVMVVAEGGCTDVECCWLWGGELEWMQRSWNKVMGVLQMQFSACHDVVTEENAMRGSKVGDGPVDTIPGMIVGRKVVWTIGGLPWVMAVLLKWGCTYW